MPTEFGFQIVSSALILAFLVFAIGLVVRAGSARKERTDGASPDLMLPPPVSGQTASGWWKVSSSIYNRYDLLAMSLVAGVYILPLIFEAFMGKQEPQKVSVELALGTVLMQFFLVALVAFFVSWRQSPVRWLGLRWPMWPLIFPIAIVGVLFTWGVLGVLQLGGFFEWLQDKLGNDGKQEVVKAFAEADDPAMLGMLVVLAVVVAPLTEEILFRGYLYPVSKRFIGRWPAMIFGALVFAAIHNNAQALVPLFALAILLTLAYEFTGSIWAPIGIHTLFNGATVCVQLAIKYGLIEESMA